MERERGMAHRKQCRTITTTISTTTVTTTEPHTKRRRSRQHKRRKTIAVSSPSSSEEETRTAHDSSLEPDSPSGSMDRPLDDFSPEGQQPLAPEAEDLSPFGMISVDLLFWMFRGWDIATRSATLRVCKRWYRIGSVAFDVFRTNQAFLHGLFLDSKHLGRLLSDPRLPPHYLTDPSILSVMFGRVTKGSVIMDIIQRAIHSDHMWLTCFEAAVDSCNTLAVECLLSGTPSEAGTRTIDEVPVG